MTKHVYITPQEHNCNTSQSCMICDGGLALCKSCMCLEGGLASECPDEIVDMETQQKIYNGEIDYRGGQWVKEISIHSPAYYRKEVINSTK